MRIEVERVIEMLKARNDYNISSDFLFAFENFISSGDDSQYSHWIERAISGFYETRGDRSSYRGAKDAEGIKKVCKEDRKLFLNIKKNGMKVPISVFKDKYGLDIDGRHRLVIAKALGHDFIKCEAWSGGFVPLSWPQPIRDSIRNIT
tara:strand:+ start:92 stop:535 length:444 start_codon:yes stop_codon:yes gene_type:complete